MARARGLRPAADPFLPPLGFPEPSARYRMVLRTNRQSVALARADVINHRSQCQNVLNGPWLKPAAPWSETASLTSAQAVEAARDSAALGLAQGNAPFPYRGAGYVGGFTPMPGRGGPRNRASRLSSSISGAAARNLVEATLYADGAGMPFNRFTTVHWQAAGVADALTATARLLKLIGDWMRDNGHGFAYLWVREAGDGKGEHVHILWHGPDDFPAFRGLLRRWLTACGAAWRKGVCCTESIGRSLGHAASGGDDYRANLDRTLGYVLKGAEPAVLAALGFSLSEPGGELVGKRCGTSQNIGPAARA